MTAPVPVDFHELLDALLREEMTPEQHGRLEAILRSSSDARQEYFRGIDLHLNLKTLLEGMPHEVDPSADVAARATAAGPKGQPAVSRRLLKISLATVATALLLLAAWPTLQRGKSRDPGTIVQQAEVAPAPLPGRNENVRLAGSARGVLFGELTPPVGSELRRGHEYALVEGQIELAFPRGAAAILSAPAAFVIVSPDRLDLRVGTCSVHAPEGSHGFEVTTPQTRVVDLGTRFSVKVHESGDSDVQVIEGAAEVHDFDEPRNDGTRLEVGEARRYSRRGDRSSEIDFQREAYEGELSDRVISYGASKNGAGQAENLESIRVQRGRVAREYSIGELIASSVTQFRSGVSASNFAVPAGFRGTVTEALVRDNALNTGLINPGASREPLTTDPVFPGDGVTDDRLTPGMTFRFDKPVINSAGPDIVLFEVQSAVYPPQGDAFHIGPVRFEPGLRMHTIRKFDITMASADALPVAPFAVGASPRPARSLDDLKTQKLVISRQTIQFRALAVGIDLSDLGYPDGAAVEELFLQDAADDQHFIDPVYVGGLPPVPQDERAAVNDKSPPDR